MKLQVFHRTHYAYATPVRDSANEVRLQPSDYDGQNRLSFILKVLPIARLTHYLDFQRNCVHLFDVSSPHSELTIEATSIVRTRDPAILADDATPAPFATLPAATLTERCYDFLQPSRYVASSPEAWRLALDLSAGQTDVWQVALILMRYIFREFVYQPAATHVHTTMEESLRLRRGVCQDFAHVMIGLCRALKIPARYVSGYLYNGPADQLKGAQATHAWVEVFIPGIGWRGLDPTNNQQVNRHHVKIAHGRDYADVSPIRGTYHGTGQRTLTVDVLVTCLDDETDTLPPAAPSQSQTQTATS